MGLLGGHVEDEDLLWFYQKYYYMTEDEALKAIEEYREEGGEVLKAFIELTKVHGRDCCG